MKKTRRHTALHKKHNMSSVRPLVSEDEVMSLARSMRLPKKRSKLSLFKQVEWSLTKRVMVLKWTRFPTDVVHFILSFVGNESELASRIWERNVRKNTLVVFRSECNNWFRLTQQIMMPGVPMRRVWCEMRLVEMGAELKKHPKFPWEE